MNIYHGSKRIIKEPIPKGSDPHNDYGPAFYLTLDLDSAKSWACKNDSVGIVNKYSVEKRNFEHLKILDLTNKNKYNVLHWIAILMHYRVLDSSFKKNNQLVLEWLDKYYIDINQYDVVIGFRADDSYFKFPSKFVSNDLAIEDMNEIFLLGSLGVQYAFISEKAIKSLKFVSSIECDESFLGHYYSIVKKASGEFDILLNRTRDPKKHYVLDLMRKDDER